MLYAIVGVGLNAMPMAAFQDALTNLFLGATKDARNVSFVLQQWVIPSGKHTKSYGKSPFLMGKLTIHGHFQ